MENKAHYALIGVFVLLALLASVVFAVWLSAAQFNKQYDKYEVSFQGAVRGLSQGSEVRFNGIQVGEVLDINLADDDPSTVLVRIQVATNTPIHTQSFARLEPLGLTGLNYIQVFSGRAPFEPIMVKSSRELHVIQGRMSQFDTFLDGGGSVLQGAQRSLKRINAVLTPDAIDDFHGILANVNRVTGEIDTSEFDMAEFNAMITAIKLAAENVSEASNGVTVASSSIDATFKEDLSRLIARAEVSLGVVDQTLGTFEGAAGNTGGLIVDARDAINRLSNAGLNDLEETVDGFRRLVTTLSRIADNIESDPAQFIAGSEKETVELPQ
ncbi:MAG: MlaD family protein [Litorimonas sp.]